LAPASGAFHPIDDEAHDKLDDEPGDAATNEAARHCGNVQPTGRGGGSASSAEQSAQELTTTNATHGACNQVPEAAHVGTLHRLAAAGASKRATNDLREYLFHDLQPPLSIQSFVSPKSLLIRAGLAVDWRIARSSRWVNRLFLALQLVFRKATAFSSQGQSKPISRSKTPLVSGRAALPVASYPGSYRRLCRALGNSAEQRKPD
jgi:hypothetical protein